MPHDGTQDPGPPPLMPDALSGPATGGKYDTELVRVRVVEPVMPDMTEVHRAMRAVLDDEDLPAELPAVTTADPPAGEIPAQAAAPQAEQTAQKPAAPPERPAERTLPRIPAARLPAPGEVTNTAPQLRRRRFTPGASAIVALLLVFAVLVVILVVSVIDTISSLVN